MRKIEITPRLMLDSYAVGVFPMALSQDSEHLIWVEPQVRGIIPLDGFHLGKRLRRSLRRYPFRWTFDQNFKGVVSACAEATPQRPSTWINATLEEVYGELFASSRAHSVEVWRKDADGNDELLGGLFGVTVGRAFFGESMFSRVSLASQLALTVLVVRLREAGFSLLDCQFTNDHLKRFGCVSCGRTTYASLLADALRGSVPDFMDRYHPHEVAAYLDDPQRFKAPLRRVLPSVTDDGSDVRG